VLNCVQARFESLPPLKEAKGKKGKGGGKATPKRPQSVPLDGDQKAPGTARVRIVSYLAT